MTGGKWFDAAGKPDPMQAKRQGFEGAFVYVGTQGFAKNCTASYYRALVAAGLDVIAVVEHNQRDAELGAAAGDSYARAGLTDMAGMGFAAAVPLGVTADEHLTAGQIPTAVAFQAAASHLIRAAGRQAMGYGFMEYVHALRPAGLVDIEWQAGQWALVDGRTHFWQDNTATESVGGVTVDRDWKRREYIVSGPVDLTPAATNAVWMQQCQIVWPKGSANAQLALSQGAVANPDGSVTETHPAALWLEVMAGRGALEQQELAALKTGLSALQTSTAQVDADVKAGDASLGAQVATLQKSMNGIADLLATLAPANLTGQANVTITLAPATSNPAGGTP